MAAAVADSPLAGGVVVIDMPNSGQAAVAVARPGLARSDPRFFPALAGNAILGGGYSARLNQEIRIRRGLSYGSSSSLDARRTPGPFIAVTQTRNDAADQVLTLTLGEMRRLGTDAVSATELAARRASLTGGFGRNIETTEGIADIVALNLERGLAPDAIDSYLPSVIAVSPAEVQAAAAQLMPDAGSTIIVVGEAAKFIDRLRKTYPKLTLIPLGELNLDSDRLH